MFTLTITTPHKQTTLEFNNRKEAKAKRNEIKKDLSLKYVHGFWANEHSGIELTTNF